MRISPLGTAVLGAITLFVAACRAAPDPATSRAEVEAALAAYRQAWLAGDAEAVMAHVADSVVLFVPGLGSGAIRGKAAVRAHWFPSADTTYPITRYDIRDQRVQAGGNLAVAEGRSILGWQTTVGTLVLDSATTESEFLTVMVRQEGRWRLSRQMFVMR